MKKLIFFIIVCFVLLGCQKKEEVKSTEYYISHADVMIQVLKDCNNQGGRNCSNARDAEIFIRKQASLERKKARDWSTPEYKMTGF